VALVTISSLSCGSRGLGGDVVAAGLAGVAVGALVFIKTGAVA
jgi:hypothetical protein